MFGEHRIDSFSYVWEDALEFPVVNNFFVEQIPCQRFETLECFIFLKWSFQEDSNVTPELGSNNCNDFSGDQVFGISGIQKSNKGDQDYVQHHLNLLIRNPLPRLQLDRQNAQNLVEGVNDRFAFSAVRRNNRNGQVTGSFDFNINKLEEWGRIRIRMKGLQ